MAGQHNAEPDASSLFPAPIRVNGNRDRLSQQIHSKLGDYQLAQSLLDDPSKSIGICAEPPSPAPCLPSRRDEFKKPAHAPQNGRVHHRPYMYNKSEAPGSVGASAHRPPHLRINGFQTQNSIDSSQPPIESILKEMKSLPSPLSVIAATPRKEQENKFVFNPTLNRLVQSNSQIPNSDQTPLPKTGLDNRISNSRSSVSPDVVNKDLGLSESDDEVAATTTRLEPILSPIGSGGSASSGSESSQSDSESESSSAESSAAGETAAPPPPPQHPPPQPNPPPQQAPSGGSSNSSSAGTSLRPSWSLSNFAPPPAHPPPQDAPYDSSKELRHALADVKGKPSPISELSDSDNSSGSGTTAVRPRRRATLTPHAASSDDEPLDRNSSPRQATGAKRGRPPKKNSTEPPKKRGRPPRKRADSGQREHDPPVIPPPPTLPVNPPSHTALHDTKTHIFRKVFTPKKGDEGGGKGGKGGKGKGGKGKGQVTIIEVTAPEHDDRRRADLHADIRAQEVAERLSPGDSGRRDTDRTTGPSPRSVAERLPLPPTSDRLPIPADRTAPDRMTPNNRTPSHRTPSHRTPSHRTPSDRTPNDRDRIPSDRIPSERLPRMPMTDRLSDKFSDRHTSDRSASDRRGIELTSDRLMVDRHERTPLDRLLAEAERSNERSSGDKMSMDRSGDKLPEKTEKLVDGGALERVERLGERYVKAEADVGSAAKSAHGSERLEEASSVVGERRRVRVLVRVPLRRLRARTLHALTHKRRPPPTPHPPPLLQSVEAAPTNHERSSLYSGACADQTPIYYSYFERLPADALSDEERDHKYYLGEARRLREAAEREQEPLNRVMLYLESVLCFVLTGRVLELELDTKRAFTIYRETIEYIKSIHSMPQRFRASPHSTFSKLDILSLRVQALLYLRMFKMYNREVKEYYKIVQEYQQKPVCAESGSPVSPTPSPAGSVGSVGSAASASSGYCSGAHAVPAHAHHALLQLTKYYTFLYVAHELWEQADCLCRLRANQDLFIAVDRKCGPLTLFSTFRHLVQYVRHAISLLKNTSRE